MRIATGKVVSGKVVIEGEPLEEGSVVTVIASDADETFELGSEEERMLLTSVAEAERGETVSGEEVLRDLSNRG